jgi:GNAT superfamily N-acetyltransferase
MTAPGDDEKLFFQRYEGRESAQIAELLAKEIAARHGRRDETPLFIEARDESGAPICGMNGIIHWRWLYVRHFWVAPARRTQGLGRSLMAEVERLAREKQCAGIYLDTFDESAARFYEHLRFARCGRIENFPPGATRISLARRL